MGAPEPPEPVYDNDESDLDATFEDCRGALAFLRRELGDRVSLVGYRSGSDSGSDADTSSRSERTPPHEMA